MLKQLVFAVVLALGVAWLPSTSAHASEPNPILRAHNRGAQQDRARRQSRARRRARVRLAAPELNAAAAGASVALLIAAGFVLRSRTRRDEEDAELA